MKMKNLTKNVSKVKKNNTFSYSVWPVELDQVRKLKLKKSKTGHPVCCASSAVALFLASADPGAKNSGAGRDSYLNDEAGVPAG